MYCKSLFCTYKEQSAIETRSNFWREEEIFRRKLWLQVMSGLPSFVRQVMVCQCLAWCRNGSITANGILGALAGASWDWCVHYPHQMQPDVVQLG